MKPLTAFNNWRVSPPSFWRQDGKQYGLLDDNKAGCFLLVLKGAKLKIIATSGDGWDHVSVSAPTRCPTWEEMAWVASRFFEPGELAMQLHVPADDHINNHPFCLHWWRPLDIEIPRPPNWMVGTK